MGAPKCVKQLLIDIKGETDKKYNYNREPEYSIYSNG